MKARVEEEDYLELRDVLDVDSLTVGEYMRSPRSPKRVPVAEAHLRSRSWAGRGSMRRGVVVEGRRTSSSSITGEGARESAAEATEGARRGGILGGTKVR